MILNDLELGDMVVFRKYKKFGFVSVGALKKDGTWKRHLITQREAPELAETLSRVAEELPEYVVPGWEESPVFVVATAIH